MTKLRARWKWPDIGGLRKLEMWGLVTFGHALWSHHDEKKTEHSTTELHNTFYYWGCIFTVTHKYKSLDWTDTIDFIVASKNGLVLRGAGIYLHKCGRNGLLLEPFENRRIMFSVFLLQSLRENSESASGMQEPSFLRRDLDWTMMYLYSLPCLSAKMH